MPPVRLGDETMGARLTAQKTGVLRWIKGSLTQSEGDVPARSCVQSQAVSAHRKAATEPGVANLSRCCVDDSQIDLAQLDAIRG
jgi:hypothetical protein